MHSRAYDLDSICSAMHNVAMIWEVQFDPAFNPEFDALAAEVQDELLAQAKLLEAFGPKLGRPRVDTLKGSRHANMKELRFDAGDGVWRVAFAFDLKRSEEHTSELQSLMRISYAVFCLKKKKKINTKKIKSGYIIQQMKTK